MGMGTIFGERPDVIFFAWVALAVLVSFVEFDGEYWKVLANRSALAPADATSPPPCRAYSSSC